MTALASRLPETTVTAGGAGWRRAAWVVLPLLATLYQLLAAGLAAVLPPAFQGGVVAWLALLLGQPRLWLVVASELGCFVCWMSILARTSLAAAFPLTALSYVLVMSGGWMWFGTPITPLQLVGGALILTGAALIARTPAETPLAA